mmetsp:Transcript_2638/g.8237  ORF Transcript_2638/g.8237 Transcript_2638/m.8237 type:complete len:249 (+) Transcript_2638:4182-4928(+)
MGGGGEWRGGLSGRERSAGGGKRGVRVWGAEEGGARCCGGVFRCLGATGATGEGELGVLFVSIAPGLLEFAREVAEGAGGVVGVEEEELGGEDEELEDGFPGEGEVGSPRLALVVVDGEGGVEGVDDEIRGEAREEGDGRDAGASGVLVGVEGGRDVVGAGVERVGELVGVLDGLAAALAEVGHHGMDSVPEEADAVVDPGSEGDLEEVAVVQVALLDRLGGRVSEDVLDLRAPAVVQAQDVVDDVDR